MNGNKTPFAKFNELLHKNSFLKIISLLLAIVVWAYILYAIDPVNEKVFNKVSVNMAFEGSIPDQNGYMYLMADTNFTVSVTVSGSRSGLLNFNEDDIKASLNLNEGISEGVCDVKVVIDTGRKDVTVSDYSPKSFSIRFAERKETEFEVELMTEGTLPDGYFIKSSAYSPERIRVSGPAEELAAIDKAYVKINLDNVKSDVNGEYDIFLVDKNGANVPRQNLTISSLKAEADVSVKYQKKLKPTQDIVNESGGNEASYINVILDKTGIIGIGEEKALTSVDSCRVPIDTSQITGTGTYVFEIPEIDGITLDTKEVSAQVTLAEGVATKQITFNKQHQFVFGNGQTGTILQAVTVTVRARIEDLGALTVDTLRCRLDSAENGEYRISVVPTAGNTVNYGIVGTYTIPENKVTVNR